MGGRGATPPAGQAGGEGSKQGCQRRRPRRQASAQRVRVPAAARGARRRAGARLPLLLRAVEVALNLVRHFLERCLRSEKKNPPKAKRSERRSRPPPPRPAPHFFQSPATPLSQGLPSRGAAQVRQRQRHGTLCASGPPAPIDARGNAPLPAVARGGRARTGLVQCCGSRPKGGRGGIRRGCRARAVHLDGAADVVKRGLAVVQLRELQAVPKLRREEGLQGIARLPF